MYFIYINTLRLSKVFSYDEDFDKHLRDMESYFFDSGYSMK